MNIEVKNDEMLGRANTRTVIVDNIEIQTSLPAIEIADLPQKLAVLEKENQELKKLNKAISKGLRKVILKRNKWKKRYYREHKKNQELKEQLEVGKEQYNDLVEEKENLQEQLLNSHQIKTQQKEFIKYLNKYIKERRRLSKLHKKYSLSEERLSAQCHVLENVLLRYQETVGYKE